MAAKEQRGEVTTYGNPLDWWKYNSTDVPLLSTLARHLLAIPATQAQSKQMFSSVGQIFTIKRNRLDSNNLDPSCCPKALAGINRRVEGVERRWRVLALRACAA